MLTLLVICLCVYLAYRVLRWAFTSGPGDRRSRRSSGDGFFDGFGDSDGGGD